VGEAELAWARESAVLRLPAVDAKDFSPTWAFGTSTGQGVRVAVIDSGIEADHPALDGCVDEAAGVRFEADGHGGLAAIPGPHDDVYGHGTACAGIIHALAPDATVVSVRVLDDKLRGTAAAFYAGLAWAVDQGIEVINLSLGAARRDWALAFHDICDRGYFANSFIVTAANNVSLDSFPSLFASVTSVACNNTTDPLRFHFNPDPPTEFLARGINVEVPWVDGSTVVTTGNSFAAPHIAAFAALIKAEHRELRPFQIKTALWAASANVREATRPDRAGRGARATRRPSRPTLRTMQHREPDPPRRQDAGTRPLADTRSRAGVRPVAGVHPVAGVAVVETRPTVDTDAERAELQRVMVDYEVGELVERGPWGPVFAATRDGEPVALRRLDPTLAYDRPTLERFAASVRIAAALDHPHILPIHELREDEHFAVMVMALCPSDLARCQVEGGLDQRAAAAAVLGLLWGLHHAHAAGVLHGDLRPDNANIDELGRVVLSDVGIAAALTSDIRTTSAPTDPLSWTYLAPEQLEGAAIGPYTDVYAAGLLLFQLIARALPHPPVADLGALVRQRAAPRPRPLSQLTADVAPALAAVADRAVAEEPHRRFPSAAAMARAVEDAATVAFGPHWIESQPFRLEPVTDAGDVRRTG
jgi:hypothetical protein